MIEFSISAALLLSAVEELAYDVVMALALTEALNILVTPALLAAVRSGN